MIYYLEAYRFIEGDFFIGMFWGSKSGLDEAIDLTKEKGGTTVCYFRIKLKTTS